ncbi:MAG: hypothetical protein M1114_02740 [Candidatus Dependentiae bacterium]|nr:hypothetical protein [Candidatus Dependentiae bacterium]
MNILKQGIVLSALAAIFTFSQAMDQQQNSLLMHSIRSYHTLERKISEGDAKGFRDLLRSCSNDNSSETLDQQELTQLKERSQTILDEANAKRMFCSKRNKCIVALDMAGIVSVASIPTSVAIMFLYNPDVGLITGWTGTAASAIYAMIRATYILGYEERADKQRQIQRAIDARLSGEGNISSVPASEDTPLLGSDENV